ALLVLLNSRVMRHSYLLPSCYLLLALGGVLVTLTLPLPTTWAWVGWQALPTAAQGVWHTTFVAFLVYALTPVSTPLLYVMVWPSQPYRPPWLPPWPRPSHHYTATG
ncbi:hypothetical protein Pmani_007814, partial [Petrolisthes manimaculis]